jgi:hypothetical protein
MLLKRTKGHEESQKVLAALVAAEILLRLAIA